MQHLAGVGPGRQQWMVTKLTGVAVGGAALVVAVDLTDGGVHIDSHGPIAGAGTRGPCPSHDGLGDAVELANMPEGERAQERPQRRGGHHPVAEPLAVDPARSMSASSMQSPPATSA